MSALALSDRDLRVASLAVAAFATGATVALSAEDWARAEELLEGDALEAIAELPDDEDVPASGRRARTFDWSETTNPFANAT